VTDKLHSPFPHQQNPYVVRQKNGLAFDKFGKLIEPDRPEAHIPFNEFVYREQLIMNEHDRKQVLKTFIRIVHNISDRKNQESSWINKQGVDFDEIVCIFFDIGDPILEDYKKYKITENQYKVLKKFHSAFTGFADDNDLPEEFIDTPEWTEMAKEVLETFNYKKVRN